MKKVFFLALLTILFAATPVFFSMAQAKTSKEIKPIKKVITIKKPSAKSLPKFTPKSFGKIISYFFNPATGLVNCNMPDGKTIKAKKSDCDAVNAFWASHRPSSGGSNNNGGSNNSNNNNNGSNNNSNNDSHDNDNKPTPTPVVPTPIVTSVTVMPCTSTSCHGITTIKVLGSGFTASTRLELVGAGINGSYVGGDASTVILTDFINLPKGTFDARVFSPTHDTQDVVIPTAVTIN